MGCSVTIFVQTFKQRHACMVARKRTGHRNGIVLAKQLRIFEESSIALETQISNYIMSSEPTV